MAAALTTATAGPSLRPPRAGAGKAHGWVLLETLSAPRRFIVAEGTRPRRFTGWDKSWIGRSATMNAAAPDLIADTVATGLTHIRHVNSADGRPMQIVAVPVTDPGNQVLGVHLWAGRRGQSPPPRPAIGTLTWDPHTSLISTNGDLEQLIDAEGPTPRTRTLPEFLRCFTTFDRVGFLALLDAHRAASTWTDKPVTTGATSGKRRILHFAARSDGPDPSRTLCALIHDIGEVEPTPAPEMTSLLAYAAPIAAGHAVGAVDLATGLVHEWLAGEPDPLQRWIHEVPRIHPDDAPACRAVRLVLLGGAPQWENEFRVGFADGRWHRLHARWTVLTRHTAPQALLSVRLMPPGP
ncbi:GAF domain-containing protein [Nocardia sp. NPDC059246]|uniref:GAF domain-containing protein n=1 Tax=unclassified Nocardia TaxID=2637762 RepID=UPI0036C2155E